MKPGTKFYAAPQAIAEHIPSPGKVKLLAARLRKDSEKQARSGLFHTNIALSNYGFALRMLVAQFTASLIVDSYYIEDDDMYASQSGYLEVPHGIDAYVNKVVPDFVDMCLQAGYKVQVRPIPYKGKRVPKTVKYHIDWTYA